MSLFDVIRWPVSMPPTLEELHSIPNIIVDDWLKRHVGSYVSKSTMVVILNRFYGDESKPENHSGVCEIVEDLKRRIREYDEPI